MDIYNRKWFDTHPRKDELRSYTLGLKEGKRLLFPVPGEEDMYASWLMNGCYGLPEVDDYISTLKVMWEFMGVPFSDEQLKQEIDKLSASEKVKAEYRKRLRRLLKSLAETEPDDMENKEPDDMENKEPALPGIRIKGISPLQLNTLLPLAASTAEAIRLALACSALAYSPKEGEERQWPKPSQTEPDD